MFINVAAFTVSEQSSNTLFHAMAQKDHFYSRFFNAIITTNVPTNKDRYLGISKNNLRFENWLT